MNYNHYLKGITKISEIGLGGWQLGESSSWKSMTEKEAIELILKSLDMGINFFDTAPNYGLGTSEERLGKALSEIDRSKIVINTKFGHSDKGKFNFEADYIRESLEGSLRRLKTDYVDSFIFHNPPFNYLDGNRNPHYEILERLIEEGKIKTYGASLDTYDEMMTFMNTTNGKIIEAFFNILHQDVSRSFDLANQKGVRIIAKIPLDSGWLTGKYNTDSKFFDIRKRWSEKDIELRSKLVEKLKFLVPKNKSLSQLALSFCLAYDAVATVIPGNRNIQQLISNIECSNNPISNEMVVKLEHFYEEEVKKMEIPW